MPWCSCYSRDSVGCRLRNGASDAVLSMAKKMRFLGAAVSNGEAAVSHAVQLASQGSF